MIEIAETLKNQREAKGLTIDDLFQRTRINMDFLRALESGQFDILPETYVRLFIKKYAQEVGLNAEDVLAEYDKNVPQKETPQSPPPPAREINFQPAILICIGVFIIALLIWQVRQQTNQNTATLLEATTSTPPRNQSALPPPSSAPPAETPQPMASETPADLETPADAEPPQPIETEIPPPPQAQQSQPTASQIPQPTETPSSSIISPPTPVEEPVIPPVTPSSSEEEPTPAPTLTPVEARSLETAPPTPTNTEMPTHEASEPLVEERSALTEPIPPVTPNAEPERLTPSEQRQETPQTLSSTTPTVMPLPITIAPNNPILLSGIAQQTTQLLIKADGRTLFDGELQVGSRPRWTARDSLELTLTNHNAISLFLQNQPLQFDASIGPNIQISINRTQIRILPSQY